MCYRGCPAALPGVRFWGAQSLGSLPDLTWRRVQAGVTFSRQFQWRLMVAASLLGASAVYPLPAGPSAGCSSQMFSLTLMTPYTWAVEGRTRGLDQAVSSPSQGPSQVAESDLKPSIAVPSCFPSSYYPLVPPHGRQTTPTWSRRALKSQHVSLHLPPQHLLDTSSGLHCFLNIPSASCEVPSPRQPHELWPVYSLTGGRWGGHRESLFLCSTAEALCNCGQC